MGAGSSVGHRKRPPPPPLKSSASGSTKTKPNPFRPSPSLGDLLPFFVLQLIFFESFFSIVGCVHPFTASNPEEQPQERRTRPPLPKVEGTPVELIRRFFTLQENRAGIYRRFNDGFQSHFGGGLDGGRYDQLCREITSEMSACSLEVIAVEEALKAAGQEAPAASIRVVQMGEKVKLNMTCTLQVLKKSAAENRWTWQQSPDDAADADAAAEAAAAAAAASAHANASTATATASDVAMNGGGERGGGLNPSWANGGVVQVELV